MREVVTVQVGQCGNQIGSRFWEVLSAEHGIGFTGLYEGDSQAQLERIGIHYHEVSSRYVPRAVLCDLDPVSMDMVRAGPYSRLFSPDDYVFSNRSACNNFAVGHYTRGGEIIDQIGERIRQQAELCDQIQAIQLIHSLGGGTGSGLGSRCLGKIKEEFPAEILLTESVFPSEMVTDTAVEPYNAILCAHHLVENSDVTMVLDNEALYDICYRMLKIPNPTFGDLNYVVSSAMCGLTASMRFPGLLNADLRKMCTNLICFPRLHFFLTSFAPLIARDSVLKHAATVPELTEALFNPSNVLCSVDPRRGRYMTAGCIFRGSSVSSCEVEEDMYNRRSSQSDSFTEWLPNTFKISLCNVAPQGLTTSATMIASNSAAQMLFSKNQRRFQALFKRKAYLQWYLSEGMEEMEFTEAENNANDIVSEYTQYQDAGAESSEEEESDEEESDEDSLDIHEEG